MELQCTCGDLCWRTLCAFGCDEGPLLAQLLTSWERPKVRDGGGAGSNSPRESCPELVGGSHGFLPESDKGDKFKWTLDPYQNTGQSQQNLMDTPALTDCHPDTAGNVLIENLSRFPGLAALICAPAAQPLCPVPEATQETGGQRTMPALGLSLQSWACNLHQQDLY